jgi:hypothetical protein
MFAPIETFAKKSSGRPVGVFQGPRFGTAKRRCRPQPAALLVSGNYAGCMVRCGVLLLLAVLIISSSTLVPTGAIKSVCELSKDFPRFRDKVVAVRGVYYYGLRQEECPQKCTEGLWPSFINLDGDSDATWTALAKTTADVETKAKQTGTRFEIWVTAVGRLQTRAKHSSLGPCDRKSWGLGYGHLNGFPAQIMVESFRDIEVRVNPQ